jgi:hypothetical protein
MVNILAGAADIPALAQSQRVCVNFVGDQDRLAGCAGQAVGVWL